MKFTTPLLLTAALALSACNTAGSSNGQFAAPGTTAPVGPASGPCPQGSDLTPTGVCVTDESED